MAIISTDSTVAVIDHYREYYKVNKYLGGLIKITRVVRSEKIGQGIHITVPTDFATATYDEIFVNGVKMVPSREK